VAYDARGWGKSDKTLAGYKLADLADEALSLVKALGIKQYVLVGHSMGGQVAQLAASRRPVAHVFELTNAQTPVQLQEISTLIRSTADVMRMFVISDRRALAMRAEPERVALAAWLIKQLDLPSPPADSAPRAYTFAGDEHVHDVQGQVRVFYLPQAQSDEDRAKIATVVRSNTRIRRLFVCNSNRRPSPG
jgi:pimeloyl-ACP methyl ester carboxylesterase